MKLATPTRLGLTLAIMTFAACGGKQTQPAAPGAAGAEGAAAPAAEAAAPTPAPAPQREIPTAPQPAPDSLLATIVVADPNATLGAVQQAVAQIQPGLAAMVNTGFLDQAIAEMTGATKVAGIDYGQPVRVVMFDPSSGQGGVLVVAGVADEALLRQSVGNGIEVVARNGLAVVGAAPALDVGLGYAMTSLLSEPLPAEPTVTFHVGMVVRVHGQQIDAMLPMLEGALAGADKPAEAQAGLTMIKGLVSLAKQLDVLTLSLDVANDAVSVNLAATPVGQSNLAGFIGQQQPADFDRLAPIEPGAFSFAGRLAMGGFYDWMMSALTPLYSQIYGDKAQAMIDTSKEWAGLLGQEFTMSVGLGADGMWMVGTWDVTDGKKADKLFRSVLKLLPKKPVGEKGAEMKFKARVNAMRYRGVAVHEMSMSMAKTVPPEARAALDKMFGKGGMQFFFGAAGKRLVMAMGKDSKKRLKTVIDVVKGKKKPAAPGPGLASALARAKQHGDSMVVTYDLPALATALQVIPAAPAADVAGEPVTFAIGFAGGKLGTRITVPLDQIKALMPPGARAP